ncbi:hypothetical protein DFP72DRAFT_809188 [Ephemerocybe angulata]|uniref:VPS37 C-terminal domain-containing protein n=1 Tax=Ephemerocybe angulata TaxID=980116 RepID=A0A8H6M6H5_9AGAR|nr:hypothetical protein DFP72DRAFT_809188 [Tulosesus angulatus]
MATPLLQDYPELSHLSRAELEDLLNDPVYFQAIFHSLDRVKDMYRAQAELGMANESIAENNVTLQEPLYNLRAETQAAFDDAKALEKRWKELEKEQKEVYQRFTPQFLLMRLKHATTALDDETEAMASTFPALPSLSRDDNSGAGTPRGGLEVDDFIRQFKEGRKIYHKRAMWADKWSNNQVIWREE